MKAHVRVGLLVSAMVLAPIFLTAQSALGQSAPVGTLPVPQPHYRVLPLKTANMDAINAQSASGATIPLWSGTASYNGVNYAYQMVGKNPFVHTPNPAVGIYTPVIPVIIHFPDGTTSDPTQPTGCGTSTVFSPQQLVAGSPIFARHLYADGSTTLGMGQYITEFQRANFWNAIHSADNLRYQIQIHQDVKRMASLVVNLTAAQIAPFNPVTDPFGPPPCGHLWAIDAIALDSYVQKTLIPMLHISPTSFPIILSSNVVGYVRSPSTFLALGAHGAFTNPRGLLQTYAELEYDTSGSFFGVSDVSVLAHEVGEWVDDPLGTNPVPGFTNIGQVFGVCQQNLEVGDPLSGTTVTVGPMPNGVTYHPQELAFFSWFYNQIPSQSVNPAWYSSNGTFTAVSATNAHC